MFRKIRSGFFIVSASALLLLVGSAQNVEAGVKGGSKKLTGTLAPGQSVTYSGTFDGNGGGAFVNFRNSTSQNLKITATDSKGKTFTNYGWVNWQLPSNRTYQFRISNPTRSTIKYELYMK